MIYNDREQKLIRLALDPGAADGELQNAAVMIFRSLKNRGIMADALLNGKASSFHQQSKSSRYIFPDWGKNAGKPFDLIERQYLYWIIRVWYAKLDEDGKQSWRWLNDEILEYLK